MTDTTCKRHACDTVSPLIAGAATFCSDECERIHNAVHGDPVRGSFSWLGAPTPQRAGETSGGWPA